MSRSSLCQKEPNFASGMDLGGGVREISSDKTLVHNGIPPQSAKRKHRKRERRNQQH